MRQTFVKVIFPMSMPGVISGITMVFVPALTTFVISNLLGGGMVLLIGNVIEQEFTFTSDWNLGSGLSLVLMVFILISMALLAKYVKTERGPHSDGKVFKTVLSGDHVYFPVCAYPRAHGAVL